MSRQSAAYKQTLVLDAVFFDAAFSSATPKQIAETWFWCTLEARNIADDHDRQAVLTEMIKSVTGTDSEDDILKIAEAIQKARGCAR